ncbi:uncharacterized protein ACNLHF_010448 isoform 1-T5 [Anomaloglossus baeobatrachus]|uniref:uncharacterized protein LOC142257863 n=1 Tax=Anomaloglossus baeobatrachus TaxID=238106 RepID=UPI003F50A393
MSNTFSYNTEETSTIISQTTTPGDFLLLPPKEAKGKEFEKESRHLINFELHCATLTEYLKAQRIPRGLRVSLRPTIFSEDAEYRKKFEQILNKCSLDLMTLTVDHLQRDIKKTQERIRNIEVQLETANATVEEFNNFKHKIQSNLEQHRRDLENRKRSKFIRDADDYTQGRVYRWQDNYSTTRFRYQSRRSPSEYSNSSTDSEHRGPSTSNFAPFLGQRGGHTGRRKKQDVVDNVGGTDSLRITRSQKKY